MRQVLIDRTSRIDAIDLWAISPAPSTSRVLACDCSLDSGVVSLVSSSARVVYAALAGDLAVAAAKFGASALSGSTAMLTEAIPSLVDSADQLLLLTGQSRARKPPDRTRPYAKLFRNRELGMPLMPQLHHGQVLLVSCLAASLPARFDQRRSSGSLCLHIPRQFRPGLHLQLLDLTLDRLGQIAHQVIPIVDLHRQRRAFSPALGIQTTAVTSDHFHSRMQAKPLGKAPRRSHGKQIDHSSPLEINEHGPVPLLLPPSPVVYPQNPHFPFLGMARVRLHPPEYRISAGDHSHLLQQTRSRQSAQNITDSPQRLGQSIRFSCLRGGGAGQSPRKDLAWTVPIATAKATGLHLDLHRLPLPGQIAQAANIGPVIRNFRFRTARTSRPSPTSNPENNIPFDLLHGVLWEAQLFSGRWILSNRDPPIVHRWTNWKKVTKKRR